MYFFIEIKKKIYLFKFNIKLRFPFIWQTMTECYEEHSLKCVEMSLNWKTSTQYIYSVYEYTHTHICKYCHCICANNLYFQTSTQHEIRAYPAVQFTNTDTCTHTRIYMYILYENFSICVRDSTITKLHEEEEEYSCKNMR